MFPGMQRPRGCDTFVAFPPAAPNGTIVFGKNSDRPRGESQTICRYPGRQHVVDGAGIETELCKCTYISIPQVETTYAILISQIDWMWGAEMGANEHAVVIGNEALWTKDPASGEPQHLLGMDLVRLGLERGSTSREALQVITTLLTTYGQGGACAQDDSSFSYHNSYLIVDPTEAWVLETSGRHWVAKRITQGVRNISNCLSVRNDYDVASEGIEEYARQNGYWTKKSKLDFAAAFCTGTVEDELSDPRFCRGQELLARHSGKGTMDQQAMIDILRDHTSGICMHGGFETTQPTVHHWVTGKSHPCTSVFKEEHVTTNYEQYLAEPG